MPITVSQLSQLVEKLSFDQFCTVALEALYEKLPFGLWMVTRTDNDDWIVYKALDHQYEVQDGAVFKWMDSFCCKMVEGKGPNFASDSREVPAYEAAPIGKAIQIQSYMGYALQKPDSELIGTLCAINQEPVATDWGDHESFVQEIKSLIEISYEREFRSVKLREEAKNISSQLTDKATLEIWPDEQWTNLVSRQDEIAKRQLTATSVIHLEIEDSHLNDHSAAFISLTLRLIFDDEAFIARRTTRLFSVIVPGCTAPQLDAYVASIRNCLRVPKILVNMGYSASYYHYGLEGPLKRADGRLRAISLGRAA